VCSREAPKNEYSDYVTDITTDGDKSQPPEVGLAHHVLVCALHELGCLVQSLGTSSAPLITEPASGNNVCESCFYLMLPKEVLHWKFSFSQFLHRTSRTCFVAQLLRCITPFSKLFVATR
jgi:hypothetical protein